MLRLFLIATSLLAVSACTAGRDYAPPQARIADHTTTLPQAPELANEEPDPRWWKALDDPMLNALVEDAVLSNADLAAATARIERARALRTIAGGAGLPNVGADASAARSKSSENAIDLGGLTDGGGQGGNGVPALGGFGDPQTIYSIGTSASWEVDLFGRVRRRVEAADARVGVAEEDRNGVMLTVIADLVQNYAELRSAQAQLDIARGNLAIAEKSLELIALREDRGLASEFDVSRARGDVRSLEASLAPFEARIRANNAAIAALTGRLPTELDDRLLESRTLEPLAEPFPAGLPSSLLRRRPDVRLAERRLAAETADIGAEIADLYPSFSLTGLFGFSSLALDTLLSGGSERFSLGAALNWPIFSGGRQRAEVEEARAGAQEARELYRSAVLNAFRDTETALTRYVFAKRRLERLEDALAERKRSYEFARMRKERGLDSLLTLLDAQRQLNAARSAMAEGRAEVLAATVGAYRALGGGWGEELILSAKTDEARGLESY